MNENRCVAIVGSDGSELFITPLASHEGEDCMYVLAQIGEDLVTFYKCIPADDDIIFEEIDPEHDEFTQVYDLFLDEYETLDIDISDFEIDETD